MKKTAALLLLLCLLCLTACAAGGEVTTESSSTTDYPAAIQVDGVIYLLEQPPLPDEIDESAITGYTTSYTDTFPEKDGETNFNPELDMPYAPVDGGIVVLYENEWRLCSPKE